MLAVYCDVVRLTSIYFVQTLDRQETTNEKSKTVYMWGSVSAADKIGKVESAEISALDQGDWVFYENMGSYSQSAWMPFCGFPKPFVHYFIRDNEKYGKFLLAIDIESIITGPHPE